MTSSGQEVGKAREMEGSSLMADEDYGLSSSAPTVAVSGFIHNLLGAVLVSGVHT